MDRFQTVNGGKDTMHPFGASDLLKPPPEVVEAAEKARAARRGGAAVQGGAAVNYGPCLYFGPRGERCDRRATAAGFCAQHSSAQASRTARFVDAAAKPDVVEESDGEESAETKGDANADSVKRRSRILMALFGLVGVLWPILNELLRALISFLHRK